MKTNLEWQWWGDNDPLFGVASWAGRKKDEADAWTDDEFYSLGDDWLDFRERWDRYGMQRGIALELGCGAGRLTKRLSADFVNVIAVDVSEGMLAYARVHIPHANINWIRYDGEKLPVEDESVDAVFSCHVLQHYPSNFEQRAAFKEIYRVLKQGGSIMIHLPLHQFSAVNRKFTRLIRAEYGAYQRLANIKALFRRWQLKRWGRPYMHGVSFELDVLDSDLLAIGFEQVEFVFFPVRTNGSLHSCVLARKHNA